MSTDLRRPRLCIFCGSSHGNHPGFTTAARAVGRALAERRTAVVYGGGRVGLMGEIADAALQADGEVVGVIPRWLVDKEVAHAGLTELHVVGSMHERRQLMYDLSDAFLTLPGGLGTFEELFEVLSWAQLGLHSKPCGVLNIDGYFDFLPALLEQAIRQGLLKERFRSYPLLVDSDVDRLLAALEMSP